MKAIVQDRYGGPDELALRDVVKPVPKDDEILVRVHAAALNAYDLHVMKGDPYIARVMGIGLRKPKVRIRGRDLAGQVEAVGKNVERFRRGDEVYAESGGGSFAEYACVAAAMAGPKPANLTFEQAAAVPLAAITALQGLRDQGQLRPGQHVLINGASGGVGTFAVQLAKSFGATVTGVCNTRNVDLVQSLGADHVIDYTQEDFTATGQRYDVVFDLVANRSLVDLRRAVTPDGILVLSGGNGGRWVGALGLMANAVVRSLFARQKLRPLVWKPNTKDLIVLTELIEAGKVTPAIDRTYPLSKAPEAIRYLDIEHARAKVVITM